MTERLDLSSCYRDQIEALLHGPPVRCLSGVLSHFSVGVISE